MIAAEWFHRLRQSLEFAAGFELFVLVGRGSLAEEGLRRLADEIASFGAPRWHSLHHDGLDNLLGASEPGVLHFVHGLEHMTPAAVRGVFARLNLERQKLLLIGAPVLLWIPDEYYEELQTQAPDLIAWRSQIEMVSAKDLGLETPAFPSLYISEEDPLEFSAGIDATGELRLSHGTTSLSDHSQTVYAEHTDLQSPTETVRVKIYDFTTDAAEWKLSGQHHSDMDIVTWARGDGYTYHDFGPMFSYLQIEVSAISDQSPPQRKTSTIALKISPTSGHARPLINHPKPQRGPELVGERYRLLEEIGKGSHANIWRAYDEGARAQVAIKILHEQWTRDRSVVERFEMGARRMSKLRHPAIVPILDGPAWDQHRHYVVTPYYPGGDLLSARTGRNAALLACARAFEGLSYMHEHGLVHGDVNPGNILLDVTGRGSLGDCDLAPFVDDTISLAIPNSSAYVAPELRHDLSLDSRTDIYGAAMSTLFVLLGRLPGLLPLQPDLLGELEVSAELRDALRGALAYDPSERTTTCAQLITAIRGFAGVASGRVHAHAATWSDRGTDGQGRWAVVRIRDYALRMRWIESGKFVMGSPPDEPGRSDHEGPQHEVTLTRGFWLAELPCTQALWEAVMATNPSRFKDLSHPVEQVSWDDVQHFVFELSEQVPGPSFRLPTEAEWEYACRAGRTTAIDDLAWTWQTSGGTTRCVGLHPPNPWGLRDMLGNVWEWCHDGMRIYTSAPVVDPMGPSGGERVRRGGSWASDARFARAACRDRHDPSDRYGSVGLRLARDDG